MVDLKGQFWIAHRSVQPAGSTIQGVGMEAVCQGCGHQREPHSSVPEWQCPSCGKAYAKTSHDSQNPLFAYDDGDPAEERGGMGKRFFLVVSCVMFGNFFLMGMLYWTLTRFHLVEVESMVLVLLRFLTAFPITIGSSLILFGHIRNALCGFVFGRGGIWLREIDATEEPITFTVTLMGQLAGWTGMTYVFFKLTTYASDWSTIEF
jgi:predicted RNA-binding Zn-ribbon protein involved in translation (DUF1610 family)